MYLAQSAIQGVSTTWRLLAKDQALPTYFDVFSAVKPIGIVGLRVRELC